MKQKHMLVMMALVTLSACGHRVQTGAPGKDGLSIQGEKGDTIQGPQGPQGAPGTPGQAGEACGVTPVAASAQAPNGGALIECPTSTALILNGTPGANGTPGTVVKPLRLCPGTQQYPSTFIEVAFCIQDTLYAAYSIPGAFLTELPPGAYSSTGVGSSCSFNVGAHCQISQ